MAAAAGKRLRRKTDGSKFRRMPAHEYTPNAVQRSVICGVLPGITNF
jgi:hypothetical protein